MALDGKGMMIWNIRNCEGGNAPQIAAIAKAAGLTNVLIKVADAANYHNVDRNTNVDLVPPVVAALKAVGIEVWGWHYIYGYNPTEEGNTAVRRVNDLGLQGYIIDAESEYKLPGREDNARKFMSIVRSGLTVPIALCSYRFPSYHPQLPWKAFLEKCDINMPQVYWEKADNPGPQLQRSARELNAINPLPLIPTGPIYKAGAWTAKPAEIVAFMDTARQLGCKSANFFAWDYGRTILTSLWDAVSSYNWGTTNPSTTTTTTTPTTTTNTDTQVAVQLFSALNKHDAALVAALYNSDGTHVTSAETIQGLNAIQSWYAKLFNETLPNAEFTLMGATANGQTIQVTWQAVSPKGNIKMGADTLGIVNGKITYHYSLFIITPP